MTANRRHKVCKIANRNKIKQNMNNISRKDCTFIKKEKKTRYSIPIKLKLSTHSQKKEEAVRLLI